MKKVVLKFDLAIYKGIAERVAKCGYSRLSETYKELADDLFSDAEYNEKRMRELYHNDNE